MERREYSDETLMAYADDELDDTTAREITLAAEADAETARRIALFRKTGALLGEARAARRDAPLPDALVSRVRETLADGSDVVAFARAPRNLPWLPMAAAASLALAIGLGAGFALRPSATEAPDLAALEATGVASALSRLDSGGSQQLAAGELSVVSSFRTPDGAFCREFELASRGQGTVGVACVDGRAWELRFAVTTGSAVGDGYTPAGTLEALDTWLMAIGAGAPLSPEEEQSALYSLPD